MLLRRLFAVALCLVFAAWAAPFASADEASDAVKADMQLMQGTWMLVSATKDGKPMPADELDGLVLTVKDDTFQFSKASDLVSAHRGVYSIDPTKTPRQIDSYTDGNRSKETTALGLYQFDGDTTIYCFAPAGEDRPSELAAPAGSHFMLQVWKRVQ